MAGPGAFDEAGDAVRAFSETALINKLSRDPRVRAQIAESLPDIARVDPQLAARLQADEPDAFFEAYQLLARYDGVIPEATRQMDLPLNDDVGTAMTVYGGRGAGVPMGGPTGSGVVVPGPTGLSTQVTPRQRIPGPPQRRVGTTAGVPVGEVTPRSSPRQAPVPARLEAPDVQAERHGMEDLADAVVADAAAAAAARAEANRPGAALERARQVAGDVVRRTAVPVAATAAGVAAWEALQGNLPQWALDPIGQARATADWWTDPSLVPRPDALRRREERRIVPDVTQKPKAYSAPRPIVPDVTSKPKPMSTADLAAETSPPPSVRVEEPVVIDYSQMARDKIRQANEIQLREGRITPESAALSREADALYQRAADERRKGNHPPIMPVEMQNEQTSAIRARQRRAG
jgi:hypothetical protein